MSVVCFFNFHVLFYIMLYSLAPQLAHARPVDNLAAPKCVGLSEGAFWNRPPVLVTNLSIVERHVTKLVSGKYRNIISHAF